MQLWRDQDQVEVNGGKVMVFLNVGVLGDERPSSTKNWSNVHDIHCYTNVLSSEGNTHLHLNKYTEWQ